MYVTFLVNVIFQNKIEIRYVLIVVETHIFSILLYKQWHHNDSKLIVIFSFLSNFLMLSIIHLTFFRYSVRIVLYISNITRYQIYENKCVSKLHKTCLPLWEFARYVTTDAVLSCIQVLSRQVDFDYKTDKPKNDFTINLCQINRLFKQNTTQEPSWITIVGILWDFHK